MATSSRWRVDEGFSLIEVVMAFGILAFLLVTIAAFFIALTRSSAKNAGRSTGTLVADSVLTRTLYDIEQLPSPPAPLPTSSQFFNPAINSPPNPPIQGTEVLNGTTFTYNIYYQAVDLAGTTTPVGAAMTNDTAKKVDIVVWWWSNNPSGHRAGYGVLRAGETRIVNQRDGSS